VCLLSIDKTIKTRPIYECRCDERLKPKGEESTCLGYTGLIGEPSCCRGTGTPKIETRLIDDKFASVMGCLLCINKARVQEKTYI
jgi:hypothetical protein